MTKRNRVTLLTLFALAGAAIAAEHDYYKHLRYPARLVPGVGLDKVDQEGGPDAVGYKRRTVQWWPRKGQDVVDIPKGAPLRVWTCNKGRKDKEVPFPPEIENRRSTAGSMGGACLCSPLAFVPAFGHYPTR